MINKIDEYIEKAKFAIDECSKNFKKGKIDMNTFFNVTEKYFNDIYLYVAENIDNIDDNTFVRINSLENSLNKFIVEFNPKLSAPNEVKNSDEFLLKTIVYFARKQLYVKESVDFKCDNLRKYDSKINEFVKDVCSRLGLTFYSFNIKHILKIPKNHNVTLVKINDEYYLIDCSYQQYFMLGQNFINRITKKASNIITCEVGARILACNQMGAIELLENGFISTNDEMFEDYFTTMLSQFEKHSLTKEEYLDLIINRRKKKI